MQKFNYFRLVVIAVIVMMAVVSCSGLQNETDATDLPELSPVEETAYPVMDDQIDLAGTATVSDNRNDPASMGSWGATLLDPDLPVGELVYSGEPLEITFHLRGDATLGVVLFLDGFVQPHKVIATTRVVDSLPTSNETVVMSSHEPNGDEGITVTFSFNPVSGKEGDELCLAPLFIYNPFYMPENEDQLAGYEATRDGQVFGFNAVVGGFVSPLPVRMAADGLDSASSYAVAVQALDNPPPDPQVKPDPDIDSPKFFLYSGVDSLTPDKLKAPGGKVDLFFRIAGGLERDYRVTVFVNNQPVSIEGLQNFLMHSQFNNKVEYTFPLKLIDRQKLNSLYAVFVPVQDDCSPALFSGHLTAPILLIW